MEARRTQDGSDTEASVAHLDNSRRWLQLVHDRLSEDILNTLITISNASGCPSHARRHYTRKYKKTCQPILSVIYERCEIPGSMTKLLLTCSPSNECWKMRSVSKAQHRDAGRCMTSRQVVEAPQRVDAAHALAHSEANIRKRCELATSEERAKHRAMEICFERSPEYQAATRRTGHIILSKQGYS